MRRLLPHFAVALSVSLISASVALADAPGRALLDQVAKAYQQTRQYQATAAFTVHQTGGRWNITQSTHIPLAYDRENHRLLIDKPDLYMVVKDGRLLLKSDQIPARHLDTDAPDPLTYDKLVRAVPFVAHPPMVALAFLLSDDPVKVLTHGKQAEVTRANAAKGDSANRPRLRFKSDDAAYTLTIDPKTRLIRRAEVATTLPQRAGQPDASLVFVSNYKDAARNQPIGKETFKFDGQGSKAVSSVQALIQPASNPDGADGDVNQAGGAADGGGAPAKDQSSEGEASPLVGKKAPPVVLRKMNGGRFKLADASEKVILLDFWATWCPPCRKELPRLQALADWAKKNHKSVGFYAVNVAEKIGKVKPFWKKHGFTMPVLMDSQGKVSHAYHVSGIPQTVLIADGKVKKLHVGYRPGMEKTLKSEIQALLK